MSLEYLKIVKGENLIKLKLDTIYVVNVEYLHSINVRRVKMIDEI